MKTNINIIALIPARGGSKGIPKKNIIDLDGKPLLAYTADAALNAKMVTRTILSTDDVEIAAVGKRLGLDVPFTRPAEISSDTAAALPVMQHAINWLESNGSKVDIIVYLQPTSPFRTSQHIDEALDQMISADADSVVSVVEVPHRYNPASVMRLEDGFLKPFDPNQKEWVLRRQDKEAAFARNGPVVLAIKRDTIMSGQIYTNKTVPYVMNYEDSIDIDSLEDLKMAEAAMSWRKHSV